MACESKNRDYKDPLIRAFGALISGISEKLFKSKVDLKLPLLESS